MGLLCNKTKEGQSDGSLHQNNRQSTSGVYDAKRNSGIANGAIVENEYELFGRGSTTTTSSAGTVIFRPDAAGAQVNNGTGSNNRKKRNSQPPEPPPRNGSSNRNSTASTIASVDSTGTVKAEVEHRPQLTASESKEIADALDQLRNNRTETLTSNSKNGIELCLNHSYVITVDNHWIGTSRRASGSAGIWGKDQSQDADREDSGHVRRHTATK